MLTYYGLEVTFKDRSCILSRNPLQMLLRVTKVCFIEPKGVNWDELFQISKFHFHLGFPLFLNNGTIQ